MFPFQIGHAALKLVIPPRHFLDPKNWWEKECPKSIIFLRSMMGNNAYAAVTLMVKKNLLLP